MGKSAAADLLKVHDIPVVDTDQLARQVVSPGQPALQEIFQVFGSEILSPSGELRRDVLANRVFTDAVARRQLEEILHPRIRAMWRDRFTRLGKEGHFLAVVVIPLLFETGAEKELDFTVCVACTEITQTQRLAERGWSVEQIRQRLGAQYSIEKKTSAANFVVWNEASLDVLWEQLARVVRTVSR
jgi:dephospho-CoA kinase